MGGFSKSSKRRIIINDIDLDDVPFAALYIIQGDEGFNIVLIDGTDEHTQGYKALVMALAEVTRTNQEYLYEVYQSLIAQNPLQLVVDNSTVN